MSRGSCRSLLHMLVSLILMPGVWTCVLFTAYSIQGQNVQIISPTSESHQQVVAVGQPLSAQPQGTVVVKTRTIMSQQR